MSITKTQLKTYAMLLNRTAAMGLDPAELDALLKIERALSRWSERECNGEVERDENTQLTYSAWEGRRFGRCPDLETAAIRRLSVIEANHPALWFFNQTDPRGCALYIGERKRMTAEALKNLDCYYTQGLAVCL